MSTLIGHAAPLASFHSLGVADIAHDSSFLRTTIEWKVYDEAVWSLSRVDIHVLPREPQVSSCQHCPRIANPFCRERYV